MAENTLIEWCHHSFNPWIGCSKVSAACKFCYAWKRDKRFTGGKLWGEQAERHVTSEANWKKPLAWNRKAEKEGVRYRVFCASLADVFEDREDLDVPRARLFELIAATPHLDWLLLTKRPENIRRMLPWMVCECDCECNETSLPDPCPLHDRLIPMSDRTKGSTPWRNVWLGTTAENQEEADRRIPHLLAAPAAIHFVSYEPALGPVDFSGFMPRYDYRPTYDYWRAAFGGDGEPVLLRPGVNWIIAGAESGPGARPYELDWFRAVRDQCEDGGIAFFLKQIRNDRGKKVSLPLLDGRQWTEVPR